MNLNNDNSSNITLPINYNTSLVRDSGSGSDAIGSNDTSEESYKPEDINLNAKLPEEQFNNFDENKAVQSAEQDSSYNDKNRSVQSADKDSKSLCVSNNEESKNGNR